MEIRRRSKYPWDKWADGEVHDITKGKDYDCQTRSMEHVLRNHATDNKLKVTISRINDSLGEGLEFQFLKPKGQTPKPEIKTPEPREYEYDDRSWISDEAIAALNRQD